MKTMAIDRTAIQLLLATFEDTPAAAIEAIGTPVLVVCGVDDSDNGSASLLAEKMQNAALVTIPGNHMSAVTKPDLGAAIRDYLQA